MLDADKETKVLRQAGTKNTELAQYLLKIHASFKFLQYFSNTMKPVFHILWYVRNTCIIADKNLPKTLNSPIPPQNTWPSFKFLHYFSNTLKQVFHILS